MRPKDSSEIRGGVLPRVMALAALLAMNALTAGCTPLGSRGGGPDPFERGGATPGSVILRVDNRLQEQVTVRTVGGGPSRDVGTVPGRASEQFVVELRGPRISFQLEPFSGSRHTLPLTAVQAGDVLDLLVANPVERSVLRR